MSETNKNRKRIVLTGVGTAGHVTPNLALIPYLKKEGYDLYYVGSIDGIEKKLIADYDIPYLGIETGKLRRYFDPKNFSDPMRVVKGYVKARRFLKEFRPDLIFSKGGYVSVPVTRAAGSLRIPVILHESDMTPGLANKLCFGVATKVCCNFPETMNMLPPEKAVLTGTPIREELFQGDRQKGLSLCGFPDDRPVLMIIGGSQGAASVNKAVLDNLDKLLENFRIIHICGRGKMDNLKLTMEDYRQFEYVKDDLAHLFAAADVVISRAGANAICELLALHKPNILVPLPTAQSRGDQLLNAASFEKQGYSIVVEDDMLADVIVEKTLEVYTKRGDYIQNMEKSSQSNSIRMILDMIRELSEKGRKA